MTKITDMWVQHPPSKVKSNQDLNSDLTNLCFVQVPSTCKSSNERCGHMSEPGSDVDRRRPSDIEVDCTQMSPGLIAWEFMFPYGNFGRPNLTHGQLMNIHEGIFGIENERIKLDDSHVSDTMVHALDRKTHRDLSLIVLLIYANLRRQSWVPVEYPLLVIQTVPRPRHVLWIWVSIKDLEKQAFGSQRLFIASIAELVSEFPGSMRHICTTMPWTILPALIVLWGVCWMFIVGSQELGYERSIGTLSPTPARNGLFDCDLNTDYQTLFDCTAGENGSTAHPFDDSVLGDLANPLGFVDDTPQDPIFLTAVAILDSPTDQVVLPELTIESTASLEGQNNETSVGKQLPNPSSAGRGRIKIKQPIICPICQASFSRPNLLRRHTTSVHYRSPLFPCPNAGCKRSEDNLPYSRKDHLDRHLAVCKFTQESSSSHRTPDTSQLAPIRATDIPGTSGILEDHGQEQSGHHVGQQRPRLENSDDGPNNERLLADMKKKFHKLSDDVDKKERELIAAKNARDSLEKAILALEESQAKC